MSNRTLEKKRKFRREVGDTVVSRSLGEENKKNNFYEHNLFKNYLPYKPRE